MKERAIVMEYVPTNLQEFIEQRVASSNTRFPFTPMAALDMISQIASGMEYLHTQGVAHRDLKPNNILVSPITISELSADGYAKVKLCDFGLAKSNVPSQTEQQSWVCGALPWRAPKTFPYEDGIARSYRPKPADVYAFAIVCSQILSGELTPLPNRSPWISLIVRISAPRNERPHLPSNTYPAKLLDLIKCWDPSPQQRPCF
jgi:serine/threonine protein kinase